MKIAFIGAGSVGFTRKLAADILTVPEFQEIEICLEYISASNLELIYHVLDRDIKANKLGKVKLTKTMEQKKAIEGAKYVISVARVGGLEAFALDVEIPMKYGVNQCVGDTICAGGIMYGQRTIPVIMGVCKDIKALAEPDALYPQLYRGGAGQDRVHRHVLAKRKRRHGQLQRNPERGYSVRLFFAALPSCRRSG